MRKIPTTIAIAPITALILKASILRLIKKESGNTKRLFAQISGATRLTGLKPKAIYRKICAAEVAKAAIIKGTREARLSRLNFSLFPG